MRTWFFAALAGLMFVTSEAFAAQCLDHYAHLSTSPNPDRPPGLQIAFIKAPRLSDVKAGRVTRDATGKPVMPLLKPRPATVRPNVEGYEKNNVDFDEVVVKFSDDSLGQALEGRLFLPSTARTSMLDGVLSGFAGLDFVPAIKGGEDWLTALRYCAADNTGHDFADLTSFFSAKIPANLKKAAPGIVRALLNHPDVETAWLRGPVATPAFDLPPTTPQFEGEQAHWGAAPSGINLRNSWWILGAKGDGLRFVDVEFAWTFDHEDFPTVTDRRTQFVPAGTGHGTAVMGMLAAAHNGFGYHGGVPLAEANAADDWRNLANLTPFPLRKGDSLLVELAHTTDPKGICPTSAQQAAIPLERDDAVFNQIQQMSANGIIVYEPAGNEGMNLDACLANELGRNAGARDSGAILVGAGAVNSTGPGQCENPTAANVDIFFSNFGSRLDAYAWGQCVHTTGYIGERFNDPGNPGDARQHYSRVFNGTSSATPIVMAAGMAVQGWQKARTGRVYNAITMRALLKRFGTPTNGGNFIGKQPDVGAMMAWLQSDDDGDGVINGDELSMGQDLVDHYYLYILRRNPDPGGKLFWHGQVEHLRDFAIDPREAYRTLARTFFFSPEYLGYNRSNALFVEDLYLTFFQRLPDAGGNSYWQGQLNSGLNRESVVAAFMFSAEFTNFMNLQLTATPQREELSMIVGGYRGAYSALPDDGGIGYWRGQLRSAICQDPSTRWSATHTAASNLMNGLFFQGGYNHGRTHIQYVSDLYDAVLGRGSDLNGLQFWVNYLNAGYTRQWVLGQFLWSGEFQQRITNTVNQTPQCVP